MHFDPRNTPYSFSLRFFACAILRSSMLWACEPVKYCIAAPKHAGSTTRRSTCSPLESSTVDRVSPCDAMWVTSPNFPNRAMTTVGFLQLTTMSRSPMVSLRGRKRPNLPLFQRDLEIGDAVHFQLLVKQLDALGAEAGNAQQLEQAGWQRRHELLALRQGARVDQRRDLFRDAAPDARQVGQVELPS